MKEPLIFNFDAHEHYEAVAFAWNCARTWRDVSRIQVIDAWGMQIAAFCAAFLYLGEKKFNDQKVGRRPPQPEFSELRSITQGG
jgi:hypothetical protein